MTTPLTLAERVRSLRTTAGLSQRALALLAGLNNSHVRLIESGTRGPSVGYETVHALARALGAPVEWLGSGEGPEPSPDAVRAAVERARAARAEAAEPEVAA